MKTISSDLLEFLQDILVHADVRLDGVGLTGNLQVEKLDDGGMGSIAFYQPGHEKQERKFGQELLHAQFVDEDDVLVSLTLNVDCRGLLYEMDLWKVDFSPLIKFPNIEDISTMTITTA